jgi:hypothetical protein
MIAGKEGSMVGGVLLCLASLFCVTVTYAAVLRIRDVYPGSEFFRHGSRIYRQKDSGPGSASKSLSIFNPKIGYKLSEI